jgi:stress response protein SCP2
MKNMLVDLLPEVQGKSSDRVAHLLPSESLPIEQFCDAPTDRFTFGFRWLTAQAGSGQKRGVVDDTDPLDVIEINLHGILLTSDLKVHDAISLQKLDTSCGGVVYSPGPSDEAIIDSEQVHLSLDKLDPAVHFIAFYVSPPAAGRQRAIRRMAEYRCRVTESATNREICHTSLDISQTVQQQGSVPSYLLLFFFKLESQWYVQNGSTEAHFAVIQDFFGHFTKYATDKRVSLVRTQINANNANALKRYGHK